MTLELLPIKERSVPGMLAGRTLTRNTIWNLLGQGAPTVVAIFAIPMLIKGLGVDRFGVLSLAWMFIGYFSLFDLGLGRALTKLVAEKLGAGQDKEIPPLVWTSGFLCHRGRRMPYTSSRHAAIGDARSLVGAVFRAIHSGRGYPAIGITDMRSV